MSGLNRREDARKKPMKGQNRRKGVRTRSSEIDEKQTSGLNRSEDTRRKPMKGQNRSKGVWTRSNEIDKKRSFALRLRKRRQDAQRLKNTYVPAIPFSRNHSVSRQIRALAPRAPSLAQRTSRVRLC
jgi:hypothetical protein